MFDRFHGQLPTFMPTPSSSHPHHNHYVLLPSASQTHLPNPRPPHLPPSPPPPRAAPLNWRHKL
ncbi:hypothetical protein E2C01_059039 [Portunus trituberculatus]|uniref:Uncharacterized protein n=1 Tax=Portunus trituberculatus TaxID=210409 RepID=A0A5B7H6C2_PORTR|nr:hypothetical protein [Portunus trituberculatus]